MTRLMVLEDNEALRKVLALALGSDYEVKTAASGEEGLELFESFRPEMVLADQRMAGISGIQAMERLREHPGRPRWVLISADLDMGLARQAMSLGASDCLPKPCDLSVLKERLALAASSPLPVRGQGRPFALRVAENLHLLSHPGPGAGLDERRAEFSASLFREALSDCFGDCRRAADRLGLDLSEFMEILSRLGAAEEGISPIGMAANL